MVSYRTFNCLVQAKQYKKILNGVYYFHVLGWVHILNFGLMITVQTV
jgi:hypothetical protein